MHIYVHDIETENRYWLCTYLGGILMVANDQMVVTAAWSS
jgi:hypothetical protein